VIGLLEKDHEEESFYRRRESRKKGKFNGTND